MSDGNNTKKASVAVVDIAAEGVKLGAAYLGYTNAPFEGTVGKVLTGVVAYYVAGRVVEAVTDSPGLIPTY